MPDAIRATLHSYKSLATRKQLQITLEVPEEFAAAALRMVGIPDPSGTQWFALTRLVATPSGVQENGPQPATHPAALTPTRDNSQGEDKPRTPFKDMPRRQQAVLLCKDAAFQNWIGVHPQIAGDARESHAKTILCGKLAIASRKDLTPEGPKAEAWDRLETSFRFRDQART